MENRFQWKCANKFSLLFLIVVYFFGYMFLVPVLARNLTLFLNPNAIVMSIPILTILYAIILVLSVLITRPLWQEAWDSFKQNIVRNLFEIITMTFFVLALNFALSMVVSLYYWNARKCKPRKYKGKYYNSSNIYVILFCDFCTYRRRKCFSWRNFFILQKIYGICSFGNY